jgi:signal transduction histidine kinase
MLTSDDFSPPLLAYFVSEVQYATLKRSPYPDAAVARISAAWYLRQFDPEGARAVASEATAMNAVELNPDLQAEWLHSLARLIEGEYLWLTQDAKGAETTANELLQRLGEQPHLLIVRSDTLRLLAGLLFEQRRMTDAANAIAEARIAALFANDAVRAMQCEIMVFAWRAMYSAPIAPLGASTSLADVFMDDATVTALWHECKGAIACAAADLRAQIASWSTAYFACVDTGQLHRACRLAGSIGASYGNLDDLSSAAEWISLALSISETRNWPARTATLLLQSARISTLLRQHDDAERLLDTARDLIAPQSGASVRMHYLEYRGLLDLERKQFAHAIESYRALVDAAVNGDDATYQCEGLRGTAQCALFLGLSQEARGAANALTALLPRLAGSRYQMVAHQTISKVLSSEVAPRGEARHADIDAAIDHFEQAIALVDTVGEYAIPHDLYDDYAGLLARQGDHAGAFKYSQIAKAAYTKSLDEQASRKALALQIRIQSIQEKSDAAHNKLLAKAAMERADALERHNSVLAAIAAAGKLITDKLTVREVALAVHDSSNDSLAFEGMSIFVYNDADNSEALYPVFSRLNEIDVSVDRIDPADSKSVVSLCYQSSRAINVLAGDTELKCVFAPTRDVSPRVALYVPLVLASATIGVLGVEAVTERAFDELDVVLLRALAGYAAIALQHAQVHEELVHTVEQLRQTESALRAEKVETTTTALERDEALAFLAHDLRAPIAAIVEATAGIGAAVSAVNVHGNATRALQLTERFLNLARLDRITEEALVHLDFAGVVDDACETLMPIAVKLQKRLEVIPRFGAYIVGHRDALSRLIINLVENALRAASERVVVAIAIESKVGGDSPLLSLSVADDGTGMPSAAIEVLTGRKGFSGQSPLAMRMGLLIVAKVARIHHATIDVQVSPNSTTVRVLLPLLLDVSSDT